MTIQNSKLKTLRKKYPKFIYKNFNHEIIGSDLKIVFYFSIEPDIQFRPEIIIKNIDKKRLAKIEDGTLKNLIFHLGLMEIPSYWKATCSPEIIIKAGSLNKEQIRWWKDLIINGMGQFFYENKIDWTRPNFLKISSGQKKPNNPLRFGKNLKNRYLMPIGGGKDSIVTLETLKKMGKELNCFSLNPTKAAKEVMKTGKCKNPITVQRKIDENLLELNKKGFLNGHTPFSAYLAFLSVLVGVLLDYKNIAFSNEKSANEGNVKYLGKVINHQWSKSSEFEKKFKKYCKRYLVKNINYFSFLRKHTELEIAKMFTKYPKYFSVFSSCNACLAEAGRRRMALKKKPASAKSYGEAKWCGNCPKCLFVYAALYPFLEKKELFKIFGRDIFQNKKLLPIMRGLLGQGRPKPFECVGTFKESRRAFELSLEKALRQAQGKPIPYLLTKIK